MRRSLAAVRTAIPAAVRTAVRTAIRAAVRPAVRAGTLALALAVSAAPAGAQDGWTPLLDRTLSHWRPYLSFRHQPGYAGRAPTHPDGTPVAPIGWDRDTMGVFTVQLDGGEPVLRVSGEVYGALVSREAYGDYHLQAWVRWGARKWTPRTALLRDAGILYHSVGEPGVDWWRSWMLGQEFQIMEGHMGDYWNIAGSAVDVRAFLPEGQMNMVAGHAQPFLPVGTGSPHGGFCLRSADHESPPGQWTRLDLVTVGDRALHLVNGHVVMVLRGSREVTPAGARPLVRGRLQLQSEAAEVFFRGVRIRPLAAMPAEYARYFD